MSTSPARCMLALLCAAAGCSQVAADGRFWFSTSGVPENEPIPGTPAEFQDFDHGTNPSIDPALADVRLYVWGSLDYPGLFIHGISLDIRIFPSREDVTLVDSHFYNYHIEDFGSRWTFILEGARSPHELDDALMAAALCCDWGLSRQPADIQFDPNTLSMLLGFVDLHMLPGARAEVFFAIGSAGIISQPPGQLISFGWGDEPLLGGQYGAQSRLPDAVIVPEPATAGLLICWLLFGHRRRVPALT